MPGQEVLASALRRSPGKAQRNLDRAHDSADESYGEGRMHTRPPFAALKHSEPCTQAMVLSIHRSPRG